MNESGVLPEDFWGTSDLLQGNKKRKSTTRFGARERREKMPLRKENDGDTVVHKMAVLTLRYSYTEAAPACNVIKLTSLLP